MGSKQVFSAIAVALTIGAYFPYIRGILKGTAKPHVFSWVIWSAATTIVALAQWKAHGGVGAWPMAASGCLTITVAVLSYVHRAEISITRSDWFFFLAAMSAVPLWYLTSNPFWAVFVQTTVDILGFEPTLRKSYNAPFQEPISFYGIITVRNVISLLALESYSWTTVMFPAITGVASIAVMGLIIHRRRVVSKDVIPAKAGIQK